jgi:hypothetical protein
MCRSSVGEVFLHFARVMRDVIEQRETGLWQHVGKRLPDQMGDDLAVGEGAIDSRPHWRRDISVPPPN